MGGNLERLAKAVAARRWEKGWSQLDVWRQGGPSNSTLTKIEAGLPPAPSMSTLRKLDLGLQWKMGSARRVLEGGDASPSFEDADPAGTRLTAPSAHGRTSHQPDDPALEVLFQAAVAAYSRIGDGRKAEALRLLETAVDFVWDVYSAPGAGQETGRPDELTAPTSDGRIASG